LISVINGDAPLVGSAFADMNRRTVLALMRDADRSNRDWATLLIAQTELDTPEVREALLAAAGDEDAEVRSEAVLALAQRDRTLALPLVLRELSANEANGNIFEAAEIIGDASLIEVLEPFQEPSERPWLDDMAAAALRACKASAHSVD